MNIDVYKGETGLISETTNSSHDVFINGKIAVQPFCHSINVSKLAKNHTLAFLGYSSDTTPSMQILLNELGTWDAINKTFALIIQVKIDGNQ